jgi:hypothetical protein
MTEYRLWAQAFAAEAASDLYTCLLEESEWRRIHESMPEAKRIFASIRSGEKEIVCALGHPIRDEGAAATAAAATLYVPSWILETFGIEGMGDSATITWISEDYLPAATKIVLRPHDSAFYHADARDELEPVLTRYGCLEQGLTIPVPIEALGGYMIPFDVIRTEPANRVLMEGDEVALEFEEALDAAMAAPLPPRPGTPVPLSPEQLDGPVVSVAAAAEPEGHRLGGTTRNRLADGRAWNPWREPRE